MQKVQRSVDLLKPEMVRVAKMALRICNLYDLPFAIFETGRTIERQIWLRSHGKSKTLLSKHLKGEAFDMVLKNPDWSWDYDNNKSLWHTLGYLVPFFAGKYLGYDIVWGGTWKNFKDFPHFQYKGRING